MKQLRRTLICIACFWIAVPNACSAGERGGAHTAGANPRFRPLGGGEFEFNTGVLSGRLRSGGRFVGLLPLVHLPTGAVLTRNAGLVGHYRVFSRGRRYGSAAWNWSASAELHPDGSVEVCWPSTNERPFEMSAIYRWAGPAILDVETRVRPQQDLPDFEVFLASYFGEQFTTSLVLAQAAGGRPVFLPAEESNGSWQIFPRDHAAASVIGDGRWSIPPHPVEWAIRPMLIQPIALRRDSKSGTTVILMAPQRDCFAIATPHQTEEHYSLYLSLFGRTLKAGELTRARSRLVVAKSPTDAQVLEIYRSYIAGLPSGR
jgi:hypothetical protein